MQNLTVDEAYHKFRKLKADKQVGNYTIGDEIVDVLFLHIVWILTVLFIMTIVFIIVKYYLNGNQ